MEAKDPTLTLMQDEDITNFMRTSPRVLKQSKNASNLSPKLSQSISNSTRNTKKVPVQVRRKRWGEEENEILHQGIREYGIGAWEKIVTNLLPKHTTEDITIKVQKIMGREDLSEYMGWRPDKNDIINEYKRNKEVGQALNLWKAGVLVDTNNPKVKEMLKQNARGEVQKQKQETLSRKRKEPGSFPKYYEEQRALAHEHNIPQNSKSPTPKRSTQTPNKANRASTANGTNSSRQKQQPPSRAAAQKTSPKSAKQKLKQIVKKSAPSTPSTPSRKGANTSHTAISPASGDLFDFNDISEEEKLTKNSKINTKMNEKSEELNIKSEESEEIYDGSDFDSDENSPDNLIGEDVLVWFTDEYYVGTAVGYDPNTDQYLIRWKDGSQSYTFLRPSDRTFDESNQDRWCTVTEREREQQFKHVNKKAKLN